MLRDNPKLAKEFALNEALKDGMTSDDWNLTASNMAFDISLTEIQIQAYIEYMLKYGMIKSNLKVNEITDLSMLEKAKVTHKW
jgi:DNA-binding MarR family transcriptional regulator